MKLTRAIGLFFSAHLLVTIVVFGGGMWITAEAARSGAAEVPELGNALRSIANVLLEPARSLVIKAIPKDSIWLWAAVIVNSAIWGCALGILWAKIRYMPGRNTD